MVYGRYAEQGADSFETTTLQALFASAASAGRRGGNMSLMSITQPTRHQLALPTIIMSTCAIIGAEILLATGRITASAIVHATLILLLTAHFVRLSGAQRVAATLDNHSRLDSFIPILLLVPLLRLFSLTLSIREMPQEFRAVLIGIPLFLAIALSARYLGWTRENLAIGSWKIQGAIGLSGIPIGVIGSIGFSLPASFAIHRTGGELLLFGLVLIIFTGIMEELIFRGLLQSVLEVHFGAMGSIWTNVLFAALYLAAPTPLYAVYMFFVGLYFSYLVRVSRSLWGVMIAHSLSIVTLLIIAPLISGR